MEVDSAHVYWGNNGTDSVGRADLDGQNPVQNFISGGNVEVAVDAAHIYWANSDTGKIGRANLDASGVNQVFINTGPTPGGLAVDALSPSPSSTPGTTPGTVPLPIAAVRATISGLFQTHPVFRVGAKSTPLLGRTTRSFPRGTTFSFRLDQPATVTMRIQRKLPGRRVGAPGFGPGSARV